MFCLQQFYKWEKGEEIVPFNIVIETFWSIKFYYSRILLLQITMHKFKPKKQRLQNKIVQLEEMKGLQRD